MSYETTFNEIEINDVIWTGNGNTLKKWIVTDKGSRVIVVVNIEECDKIDFINRRWDATNEIVFNEIDLDCEIQIFRNDIIRTYPNNNSRREKYGKY